MQSPSVASSSTNTQDQQQSPVSRFQGILKAVSADDDALKTPRRQKPPKNVLTFMQKTWDKGGPMALLARCVQDQTRVKVMVRGVDRIRGHVVGFLVAFDKHWNLALVDAEETFRRMRRVKSPPVAEAQVIKDMKSMRLSAAAGSVNKSKKGSSAAAKTRETIVGYSTVHVIEKKRKSEICKRHIPQILLRGEHVASVIPISS